MRITERTGLLFTDGLAVGLLGMFGGPFFILLAMAPFSALIQIGLCAGLWVGCRVLAQGSIVGQRADGGPRSEVWWIGLVVGFLVQIGVFFVIFQWFGET